jgi:hypothetical protein
MIPDFPEEKERIMKVWNNYLERKHDELLGNFGKMPKYRNHEGHRWLLNRSDGSEDENQYHDIEGVFTINCRDVPNLTSDKIIEILDRVADDMARQTFQGVLSDIIRVTNQVGNSINANGEPFSQELYLMSLERMSFSFDENEKWIPPTLFLSPEMYAKYQASINSWGNDPKFLVKLNDIITRKKEEWLDRENSRKLVDQS